LEYSDGVLRVQERSMVGKEDLERYPHLPGYP
jgi:hypothetical protein